MAEILHHLESMKPYKFWDKLPINWSTAFQSINLDNKCIPLENHATSGCISNIHPALKGLGLKGEKNLANELRLVSWCIFMEWLNNQ